MTIAPSGLAIDNSATIGVRAGAIGEQVASSSFPKPTIKPFEDVDAALDALLTGKVTAFVAKSPAPELLMATAGSKLVLPLTDPLARSSEAFVVRKGDSGLLSLLDTRFLCQQDTGWLGERRKYWFNGFAWEDQL